MHKLDSKNFYEEPLYLIFLKILKGNYTKMFSYTPARHVKRSRYFIKQYRNNIKHL